MDDSHIDELVEEIISLRQENRWLNDELRVLLKENQRLSSEIEKLEKPQKKVSFGENKVFEIPNRQEILRQRKNHSRKTVFRNDTKPKCEKIVCSGDCGVTIHDKNQIPCTFLKTNRCVKGANCEYSHLCAAEFNEQNCKFGDNCHFDH